jgi:hypothetical protein
MLWLVLLQHKNRIEIPELRAVGPHTPLVSKKCGSLSYFDPRYRPVVLNTPFFEVNTTWWPF